MKQKKYISTWTCWRYQLGLFFKLDISAYIFLTNLQKYTEHNPSLVFMYLYLPVLLIKKVQCGFSVHVDKINKKKCIVHSSLWMCTDNILRFAFFFLLLFFLGLHYLIFKESCMINDYSNLRKISIDILHILGINFVSWEMYCIWLWRWFKKKTIL